MKDIKLLTLKKVCLPQTMHLKYLLEADKSNYVSFQDYHLIDISPVCVNNGDMEWNHIYESVKESRMETENEEIRICQSIPIFGDAIQFWKLKSPELSISFLQLVNHERISHEGIEQIIKNAFKNAKISSENWCIYYSLDFCDLILFTRNLNICLLRKILWEIASNGGKRNIKDISTQLAFSRARVIETFEKFDEVSDPVDLLISEYKKQLQESNCFDLSIAANLQIYTKYNWFKEKLEFCAEKGCVGKPTFYKVFGRNDINITVPNSTTDFLLYSAYLLNEMVVTNMEPANSIGVFRLSPKILDTWGADNAVKIEANSDLYNIIKEELFNAAKQIDISVIAGGRYSDGGCSTEMCRSLMNLSKEGFSEEFVLAMLEPFAGFLGMLRNDIGDSSAMWRLLRSFTMGVTLLSQTIMHNDGEFVHAPLFQARLFDVPPKLIALYEVIAHKIVLLLTDAEEIARGQHFYFLFNPDFSKDIYVEKISPVVLQSESNLSVVYMNESMFYNPPIAISVLCHEIAHQVGSTARKRELRIKYICRCLAYYYFYDIFDVDESECAITVFRDLADALGDAFASMYITNSSENGRYYLQHFRNYLIEYDYFLIRPMGKDTKFESELFSIIVSSWEKTINSLDDIQRTLLFEMSEQWLGSPYLCKTECTNKDHVLSKFLLIRLKRNIRYVSADSNYVAKHAHRFDAIIEAFSEAYSDLRMIELLDIKDFNSYYAKRKYTSTNDPDEQLSSMLRTEGIRYYFGDSVTTEEIYDSLTIATLGNYLAECENPDLRNNCEIKQYCSPMMGNRSAGSEFDTIRNILLSYRKELKQIVADAVADENATKN